MADAKYKKFHDWLDEDLKEKLDNAIMFERNMTRKMIEQEAKKQSEQRTKVESSRRGTIGVGGGKERVSKERTPSKPA